MYIYSKLDSIYPSIESLNELNIPYIITNKNNILINLDRNKYTIISNNKGKDSLSYFIVDTYNYRIIASGNLINNNNEQYYCNGDLRVYSNYLLTTYEYYIEDNDCSYSNYFNERLIRETNKKVKNK